MEGGMNRTCILCAHFWLSTACADWSDETPGDQFTMGCLKNKWPSAFDAFSETKKSFRERLTTAKKCPEFLHHSKAPKPNPKDPPGLNWTGTCE